MRRRDFMVFAGSSFLAACAGKVPSLEKIDSDDPIRMNEPVFIPGGEFLMGQNGDRDHAPAHPVSLNPFLMDRYEVTNAQYLAFCEITERKLPEFWGMDRYRSGPQYPNHPVIGVSWWDAFDYAQWAEKRLPTEAEWEYAARGGLAGKKYPQGNRLSPAFGNYAKSELGGPVEVGSYPANGFGLYDMMGNVLEWVHDRYAADYYSSSLSENPYGPEKGRFRVIRGAGWHTGPGCTMVYHRNALPSNWVDFAVGFRCVKDV